LSGELTPVAQDHARATPAPMLEKTHGLVDWQRSAREIHDLVRGTHPWPGAYTHLDGARIKLHRARVLAAEGRHGEPGSVLRADRHAIEVACGSGVLAIEELQPEGKRRMSAAEFCAGTRLQQGVHLS
jgi:methionyl-tRNA formyltransferase